MRIHHGGSRIFYACDGPSCDQTTRVTIASTTGWIHWNNGQYCSEECKTAKFMEGLKRP